MELQLFKCLSCSGDSVGSKELRFAEDLAGPALTNDQSLLLINGRRLGVFDCWSHCLATNVWTPRIYHMFILSSAALVFETLKYYSYLKYTLYCFFCQRFGSLESCSRNRLGQARWRNGSSFLGHGDRLARETGHLFLRLERCGLLWKSDTAKTLQAKSLYT